MHFLFSALGSAGDVHPFIAIAQALRDRGHDVRLIAAPPFEARIRAAGIDFAPMGTTADFERLVALPELWHPRTGARLLLDELLGHLREAYDTTLAQVSDPGTIVVGSTLSWGLRMVQETKGLRGATIHLSPVCLPSTTQPPILPGFGDPSWMPVWAMRMLLWAAEHALLDPLMAPRLNRVRASVGLPPVTRVWRRWMHSPDLVIGAWPEWFAPAQADWPPNTVTSGFPLFHEREAAAAFPHAALTTVVAPSHAMATPPPTPMPTVPTSPAASTIESFLAAGAPPIAFTPGSAMAHGERFFARALEAADAVGARALLITPYAAQLPREVPRWAHHAAYAPFSALLPRLAALVHHGGIGTSAQALAAGIPQAVVPFAHDQFDNAARLRRAGVSETLKVASPVGRWRSALDRLMHDDDLRREARRHAASMAQADDPARSIATMLEGLGAPR